MIDSEITKNEEIKKLERRVERYKKKLILATKLFQLYHGYYKDLDFYDRFYGERGVKDREARGKVDRLTQEYIYREKQIDKEFEDLDI